MDTKDVSNASPRCDFSGFSDKDFKEMKSWFASEYFHPVTHPEPHCFGSFTMGDVCFDVMATCSDAPYEEKTPYAIYLQGFYPHDSADEHAPYSEVVSGFAYDKAPTILLKEYSLPEASELTYPDFEKSVELYVQAHPKDLPKQMLPHLFQQKTQDFWEKMKFKMKFPAIPIYEHGAGEILPSEREQIAPFYLYDYQGRDVEMSKNRPTAPSRYKLVPDVRLCSPELNLGLSNVYQDSLGDIAQKIAPLYDTCVEVFHRIEALRTPSSDNVTNLYRESFHFAKLNDDSIFDHPYDAAAMEAAKTLAKNRGIILRDKAIDVIRKNDPLAVIGNQSEHRDYATELYQKAEQSLKKSAQR